ncbi:hypothetical protein [Haloarchaeobius sp. DT45]|uniref:hypothetical protein n=1 Tax=Haloarchaeobius sp. DT45 TaxID=3446116 RepID=UPI003F6D837B
MTDMAVVWCGVLANDSELAYTTTAKIAFLGIRDASLWKGLGDEPAGSEQFPNEADSDVSVNDRRTLVPERSPPEVVRLRYGTPESDVRGSFEVHPG